MGCGAHGLRLAQAVVADPATGSTRRASWRTRAPRRPISSRPLVGMSAWSSPVAVTCSAARVSRTRGRERAPSDEPSAESRERDDRAADDQVAVSQRIEDAMGLCEASCKLHRAAVRPSARCRRGMACRRSSRYENGPCLPTQRRACRLLSIGITSSEFRAVDRPCAPTHWMCAPTASDSCSSSPGKVRGRVRCSHGLSRPAAVPIEERACGVGQASGRSRCATGRWC